MYCTVSTEYITHIRPRQTAWRKLSRSDQGYPLRRCARNFDDKLDILRGDGRLWKPKCQKKKTDRHGIEG